MMVGPLQWSVGQEDPSIQEGIREALRVQIDF